jgi:L-ascorbate metabolism protein UlaG (beta-lactamase superfamily)
LASRFEPPREIAPGSGTAAWQISDGDTVILVDPYLSQIVVPLPGAGSASSGRVPGDLRPLHSWDEVVPPDAATIDAHIHRADFVLVTHTHIDHVMDV